MFHPDIAILVVDDFGTMRRIIKNILREIGFSNVTEADDGSTGWTEIKKNTFDLIVTDWNMPIMTGLELLQKIRATPETQHLPVLMVTAETKKEQIITAAQAGVNGYIVKPFNAGTLKDKLTLIADRIEAKQD